MKKITFLTTICLLCSLVSYGQLSDTLITWSLANDTSTTYVSPDLKAKGEMFGKNITSVSYSNGYQKIMPPTGGWTSTIDTTTTAGVYLDFPFGLNTITPYGSNTTLMPYSISLNAYADVLNDSIKITAYYYDSSLHYDSTDFFLKDTTKIYYVTLSTSTTFAMYYQFRNSKWYFFFTNPYIYPPHYDSTIYTEYLNPYPQIAEVQKVGEYIIKSNSVNFPDSINSSSSFQAWLNLPKNIKSDNGRVLFLRIYISSTSPNANVYLKNVAIGGEIITLLPIYFNSFTATKNNNSIQLNWQMKDEINIDKYIVEKSANQDLYKPIATVVSVNKNNYNTVDENPNKGDNFYRIKAISKDGKITYSSVAKVVFWANDIDIKINPNPVKNILNATIENTKAEKIFVQIADMQGNILQQKELLLQVGNNKFSISTSNLKAGTYSLIINGSKKQNIQFIKE